MFAARLSQRSFSLCQVWKKRFVCSMEGVPTTAGPNKIPLHPEAIKLLKFRKDNGIKSYSEMEVLEAREFQAKTLAESTYCYDFKGDISDLKVPSQEVKGGIPIRVYKPRSSRSDPAILVYFHGGGQVLGNVPMYDTCCKILAEMSDAIVVSVEYRLAPEHKLPAPIDDCGAATRWVMANKTKVGGTSASVVGVGGDSAGGQSAAMACHNIKGLAFQVLIYGRLDERCTYPSFKEFKDGPYMTWDLVMWYQKHRLPDQKESLTNPQFSAILQKKFDNLPPTLFVVAECDPFRDDNFEYHKKLVAAGVDAKLYVAKGTLHGFFHNPVAYKECCNKAYSEVADFIKKVVYKE